MLLEVLSGGGVHVYIAGHPVYAILAWACIVCFLNRYMYYIFNVHACQSEYLLNGFYMRQA